MSVTLRDVKRRPDRLPGGKKRIKWVSLGRSLPNVRFRVTEEDHAFLREQARRDGVTMAHILTEFMVWGLLKMNEAA